jgi:hypothetical protein
VGEGIVRWPALLAYRAQVKLRRFH